MEEQEIVNEQHTG
ncbi:BnaC04g02390D [Brassica napus]|uniref:BnaC04g02390D protein n=1 Tax=Brassica napus TaxID=3708 RepID=A0A078INM0_BRANA|nr:BnaC04g02390D [Brassica napus]